MKASDDAARDPLPLPSSVIAAFLSLSGRARVWRSEGALHRAVATRSPGPAAPTPRQSRSLAVSPLPGAPWPTTVLEPGDARGSMLWFHGGGYVFDLDARHWELLCELARRTGARVLVPRYPLAPEGRAAEIVPQAVALARRIGAGGPLVLAGDSAGGGLALAVAQGMRDAGDGGAPLVLSAPWIDAEVAVPDELVDADPWLHPVGLRAAAALWAAELPVRHPLVSPGNGDFAGLGPITVFSGTRDVLNADARALVGSARAAGVRVRFDEAPRMLHNYPLLPVRSAAAARRAMTTAVLAATRPSGRGPVRFPA